MCADLAARAEHSLGRPSDADRREKALPHRGAQPPALQAVHDAGVQARLLGAPDERPVRVTGRPAALAELRRRSDDLGRVPPAHGSPGALREPAGDHRPDGGVGGPARPVGADEARLPAVEVGLVDEAVIEHRAHRLVAREVRDHRRVDVRLMPVLGEPRDGLSAVVGVHRARGNGRLPADLVQTEPQRRPCGARDGATGLREDGLRGPSEGIPEGLLDPAEVRRPCVRPAVADEERVGVRVRVRVKGELVHDRPLPPARPIGGAHVADAADGRGRGVRRR